MMRTYPLESLTVEEAAKLQFKVVDEITRVFPGQEFLSRGDLGVVAGKGKPLMTERAEAVIAGIFDCEQALLVRGAGTGAIRYGLFSFMKAGDTLLIHDAPVYTTTKTTIEMLGLKVIKADFNDLAKVSGILERHREISGVLIQYTRQQPGDCYEIGAVIQTIKAIRDIPIITDDNYAAMKVHRTGAEWGADLSCFSAFKLLGPEGIGVIIGQSQYIEKLEALHYSGGMQVQGHEAMAVLRGMTYAPVALAIQASIGERVLERLLKGEIPEVQDAFLANAQSKVLLVEFKEPIAKAVLKAAEALGAAPYPVGAESKYELIPMFYRVSGTFLAEDPERGQRMIRINPMRGGDETVMRILQEAVKRAMRCS